MSTVSPQRVSPNCNLFDGVPEPPRARRNPMVMQLDIDFVAYMWVIGILMVVVAVIGYFVVGTSFREHNRERERKLTGEAHRRYWDTDSPDGYGHR